MDGLRRVHPSTNNSFEKSSPFNEWIISNMALVVCWDPQSLHINVNVRPPTVAIASGTLRCSISHRNIVPAWIRDVTTMAI